jgi:hypothetical protein
VKEVTSRFFLGSTKTRRSIGGATFGRPSTAELRRWLNDRATPRVVKNEIWSFLQYRRDPQAAYAQGREERRKDKSVFRRAGRAVRLLERSIA